MAKTRKNLLESIVSNHFGARASTPDETQYAFLAKNWEHLKSIIASKIPEGVYSVGHILKELRKDYQVGFSEQEFRQIYEQFISPDVSKLEKLAYLSGQVSIPLSSEQVKRAWSNFFASAWKKNSLEELVKSLGNPELSQTQIDTICNDYLSLQAGEAKSQRKGNVLQAEDIFELLKITNMTPRWDTALAQRAYDAQIHLLDNNCCSDRFKLMQSIGASPNPVKVQARYKSLIQEKNRDSDYRAYQDDVGSLASDLALVIKRTSLTFNEETKTLLKEFYTRNLNGRNFPAMKNLEKSTGVRLEKGIISKVYQDFLKSGNIAEITYLAEQSQVPPQINPRAVQEAYTALFMQAKFDSALRVYLFTDVEPKTNPKFVASGLKILLKKKMEKKSSQRDIEYQTLDWLQDNFPEQTSGFVKLKLKNLIKSRDFWQAYELSTHAGNSAPEERYVVFCEKGFWYNAKQLFEAHRESITKSYPEYAELAEHFP